ncbi:unnamed protein product, partial [Ectocarpus fasciculatus]
RHPDLLLGLGTAGRRLHLPAFPLPFLARPLPSSVRFFRRSLCSDLFCSCRRFRFRNVAAAAAAVACLFHRSPFFYRPGLSACRFRTTLLLSPLRGSSLTAAFAAIATAVTAAYRRGFL